jgi:3-hydroxybutyryl-CoA dehydrogenase
MKIETIAVLGSGTMGAGIAQAALGTGCSVVLYDVQASALESARTRIAAGLNKQGQTDAIKRLRLASALEEIAGSALVIEAVPEQIELKREVFARVGAICPAPAIIASNTSSLPITLLASACPAPERFAGLHFFNPVHHMALVEVIRAGQTDEATVAALLAFVERLGKTAVLAHDTPGFVVNRVARPYYGESLRLLGEGVARPDQIDTLLQQAGGFPLGPFALMDLIGIDINFAVTRSMYEQSFHEPRYRPHPIQQQMVLQGTLGRKMGRGFYVYDERRTTKDGGRTTDDERRRTEDERRTTDEQQSPISNLQSPISNSVLISSGSWGAQMADLCASAGFTILEELPYDFADVRGAFVVAGRDEGALDQTMILDRQLPPDLPLFVQCADITASEIAGLLSRPERLVGFDGLFTDGTLTLAATPLLADAARDIAEALIQQLGRTPIWVADSPALVVSRVVAMLANEAAFALGENVADAATIDTAMRLGANHPVGPLARAEQIGYDKIVAILDHLRAEYGEERYRVAPVLRRAARVGKLAGTCEKS